MRTVTSIDITRHYANNAGDKAVYGGDKLGWGIQNKQGVWLVPPCHDTQDKAWAVYAAKDKSGLLHRR